MMWRDKLILISEEKWVQVLSLFVLIILISFTAIKIYSKAYWGGAYDLNNYLQFSRSLLEGEMPYYGGSPNQHIYLLFLSFILIPLTFIPYWLTIFLLYIFSAFSLVYSTYIFLKLYAREIDVDIVSGFYIVFIFLFFLNPIQNNLINGQVNFFVLLLCILFFRDIIEGREVKSSIYLSFAISLKLFPVIFILYLLMKRKFKMIFYVLVISALLFLLPIIVIGEDIFKYYAYYFADLIKDILFSLPEYGGGLYFTIYGFIYYVFPKSSQWLWVRILSAGIFLFWVIYLQLMDEKRRGQKNDIWIFSLYLLTVFLINPFTEKYYLILLLPAFLLVILRLIYRKGVLRSMEGILIIIFISLFITATLTGYLAVYFFSILILYTHLSYIIMYGHRKDDVDLIGMNDIRTE